MTTFAEQMMGILGIMPTSKEDGYADKKHNRKKRRLSLVTDLGGQEKLLIANLAENGLPSRAIEKLADYMNLEKKDIAALLAVHPRTLYRKALQGKLVSDRALYIAEVAAKGTQVFGNKEKFIHWLNTPSITLGNKKPISFMNNKYGIDIVKDELVRIEYGGAV